MKKLIINGEKINKQSIETEMEQLRPQYEQYARDNNSEPSDEQLREWCIENIIERTLLKQESEEKNLKPEQLLELAVQYVIPSSNDDAKAYYDNHPDEFIQPESASASHIVKHITHPDQKTEAYVQICNIQERLKKGESFEKLATELSDSPDNAGDLGYFYKGQMVKELDDVAFNMKPGDVSDVFLTQFGYHILKLDDRQPAAPVSFGQASEHIKQHLDAEKKNTAIEAFIDDLKSKAEIKK